MIANVIRTCFPVAAKALADKAEDVNKLNVFPVPDGDTGTNMSLTLGTVVKEVQALPADATMDEIAKAITHGSLMGARGNSGVITSQILRGIAEGLCEAKNQEEPTPADVARAWRRGVKVAFKAVRKPVEGTILTVLRDISNRADKLEKTKITTTEMLDALVVEAYESVARTPDLLPVLKENGVVDSGAYGFATFFEAFVNAVEGKAGELSDFDPTVTAADAKSDVSSKVQIELNNDWEGSEFRYCNEFLFHAEKPFDPDEALSHLATLGDCELVVGSYPDYKVHVHSNDAEQGPRVHARASVRSSRSSSTTWTSRQPTAPQRSRRTRRPLPPRRPPRSPSASSPSPPAPARQSILKSLGVDVVVSGGQTMNPSTADILGASRGDQRRERHRAAQQRQHPHGRRGRGVRVRGQARCRRPDQDRAAGVQRPCSPSTPTPRLEDDAEAMREAVAEVRDGEVTRAVRDSQAADGSPDPRRRRHGHPSPAPSTWWAMTSSRSPLDLHRKRMQDEEEGDSLTILAGADMDRRGLREPRRRHRGGPARPRDRRAPW